MMASQTPGSNGSTKRGSVKGSGRRSKLRHGRHSGLRGGPWGWQERKLHGRKTSRQVAARAHARGCDGSSGRAFVAYFADGSIGKNDAAAGRISGRAKGHLQLRNVHAVRATEILQGGG